MVLKEYRSNRVAQHFEFLQMTAYDELPLPDVADFSLVGSTNLKTRI